MGHYPTLGAEHGARLCGRGRIKATWRIMSGLARNPLRCPGTGACKGRGLLRPVYQICDICGFGVPGAGLLIAVARICCISLIAELCRRVPSLANIVSTDPSPHKRSVLCNGTGLLLYAYFLNKVES